MITINSRLLKLSAGLIDIRLRKRRRHSKVPLANHVQRPELAGIRDVLRSGVERLEGRGRELCFPLAGLIGGERVEERHRGRKLLVLVPEDTAGAFEAEPGG